MKSKRKVYPERGRRVFVAMSGGVDSSVAALLLKKQGYDCTGVFMRCYNIDGCAERDAEDARRVAEHIGIPFYTFDFEEEYKKRVVEYMVEGYRAGITPNPDVMCNREIKFGLFLKKALSLGADYVATGHYVRLGVRRQALGVSEKKGTNSLKPKAYCLMAARDAQKDQSYFLWTLTQEQLGYCLFPIGNYLKSEVRAMAKHAGLPTAEKKDSQGICFLGDVSLLDFLKQYLPEHEGKVLSTAGEKIGEHEGAHFFTIGQRHLGISNIKRQRSKKGEDQKPVYVVEKDVVANTVTVAEGSEHPALYRKEITLTDVHFIDPHSLEIGNLKFEIPVFARVRYRQPLFPAKLHLICGQGSKVKSYKLIFEKPQKFIAPGQSAVFYSKDGEMVGGGVIIE